MYIYIYVYIYIYIYIYIQVGRRLRALEPGRAPYLEILGLWILSTWTGRISKYILDIY